MRTFTTDRLILRPLTWNDLDFLQKLHDDPDVVRYIGYGKPRTEAENRKVIESTLAAYASDGLGHLAISLKEPEVLIGRCGLSLVEMEATPKGDEGPQCFWNRGSAPDGMDIIHRFELGYTLAQEFWGQGYATEATRAIRDYGFQDRQEDQLIAAIFPENIASQNVARKLGFSTSKKIVAFGQSAELWELERSEWEHLASR